MRYLMIFAVTLLTLFLFPSPALAQTTTPRLKVVPTFHSLGIYWNPASGSQTTTASVRYRQSGTSEWKNGLDLWFDPRGLAGQPPEYRGSLVNLRPGTSYEIELRLANSSTVATTTASTWSETFPVARTITVSNSTQTLRVDQSGTPNGYVLYTPVAGQTATIDVANNSDINIGVTASYVIIRGLTLKGAARDAIRLQTGVHDVAIEENDISGWGRVDSSGRGVAEDAAVYASGSSNAERIIIQRNKIHHPRGGANSWLETTGSCTSTRCHPHGPQAVTFYNTKGNHVFRYNEVYSDNSHFYNDIFSGGSNYSYQGFPNRDSDIYGNYLERSWDNPIEAEGANMNVRIWGNFIDKAYKPIANNATSIGPLYIFRNVSQDSCYGPCYGSASKTDADPRGPFLKAGSRVGSDNIYYGDGKVYLFHNTMLQRTLSGYTYPLGVSGGVGSGNGIKTGIYGRNNIWYVHKSTDKSIVDDNTDGAYLKKNDHDFDLYNGIVDKTSVHERNGVRGVPVFNADPADKQYPLAANSPGQDAGARLPGFNDSFVGTGPDIGAYEAGAAPLEFGVNAYRSTSPTTTSAPTSITCVLLTDADGNNRVDTNDYDVWLSHYRQTTNRPAGERQLDGDFNQDARIDLIDYSIWIKEQNRTCP